MNPYYVIRNLLFQTKHIYAGPTRIVSEVVTLNDYKKLTTNQTPILFYYHSDQLGSTGYITDRTGQILEHEEYLPSGESWFEELKNGSANSRLPWQFNGKELDETGLYYYGARYYNPRAGVWMSPDPAFDGAFGTPMGLARYTYAHNNPVRFTDPMGLSAKSGTWTAEDSLNLGGMENGDTAALGLNVSGPGTSNAHATPSTSKFGLVRLETPFEPGGSQISPDDGGGGTTSVGQKSGSNGTSGTLKDPAPGYVSGIQVFSMATLPFSFGAGLAPKAAGAGEGWAEARAAQLAEQIPAGSRGRITMAAGLARDAEGNLVKLIGTSEANGYLRPGVTLFEDEVMVAGPRFSHAENDIASYVQANGWTLIETAATRPICPACMGATYAAGGVPLGPLRLSH